MSERGFTLVELLVGTLVTLVVLGIALSIVVSARASFDRDSAGSDLAQRMRLGLQSLSHDLRGAGAGAAVAEHIRLSDSVPVVVPLPHLDASESEPADGLFHAVRIITVPSAAGQARLREPAAFAAGPVRFGAPPLCPDAQPACGFEPGQNAVLFDGTAIHDFVEIGAIDAFDYSITPALPVRGRYESRAAVAAVDVVTYGLRPDEAGGQRLVKANAGGATMPLIDHVVDFTVDVYGAAVPPTPAAEALAAPTYGPRPPPPAEDDERDPFGPGENCTIVVGADGARLPRLPVLGAPGQLVPLTPAMLADGPWCPGSGSGMDFDADLLRIRRVDVRLRVEVASAMLRGPTGRLFRRPGQGSRSVNWVPDAELRLSIAPRNLPHP